MGISEVRRSDGTTVYRIRVELPPDPATGRRRWHSETVTGKRKAQARLTELASQRGGGARELGRRRMSEYLVDDWLPHYRSQVRMSTYLMREMHVRLRIAPTWGMVRLHDLVPLDIERWYRELMAGGLSAGTVRAIHQTMSVALGQAERWGVVPYSPMRRVRPPAATEREVEVWTDEQIARAINSESDPRYRVLWAVLAATGMRRGEAVALRWDDVDLERRVIRVDETATHGEGWQLTVGPSKTRAGVRRVTVGETIALLLAGERAAQADRRRQHGAGWIDEGWVFDRGDGGMIRPTSLDLPWRRACERAGIRGTLHKLRHSHITHLAAAGVPLAVIAERVGHGNVSYMVRVYGHVLPEQQGAAAAIGERLLAGIGGHCDAL